MKPVFSGGLVPLVASKTFKPNNNLAQEECWKTDRTPFNKFVTGIVNKITFSCGKVYVDQTGRWLNERLGEH